MKIVNSHFLTEDPFELEVQKAYLDSKHEKLSPHDLKVFIESMIAYEGLFEDFLKSPHSVAFEIFKHNIDNHLYIPCYALELRNILRKKTIVSNYKIAALPLTTAKKYLSEYGVFLVLDKNKLEADRILSIDGVQIFEPELNFGNSLIRVLACERLDSDNSNTVAKIVADECPHLGFSVLTDIPGVSHPKLAQDMNLQRKLRKFIVNVPSVEINEEVIKSTDAKSALQEALDRKWQTTKNPHKNPEFTADYWLTSPTINGDPSLLHNLVHEADGTTYLVKTSAEKSRLKLPLNIEQDEQEIFDFLLAVNNKYKLGLTFRVAGGWVRDRALGVKSKDIDIALDKMTGAEFGKYITKETGKKPSIIEADEKKSKSLETATINLGSTNIPIDFVNLRKEVYEPGSRVPKMTFGTPEEDAERRDLTINSLFYNVNEAKIEDFTGKGLEDLNDLTLRTPLDPKQTFADDPLRVFRVLRFFAKFKGAKIADETLQAIKDPEVQEALDPKTVVEVEVTDPKTGKTKIEKQRKISEERILTEWQKLHKGPQAAAALRIAFESGLWDRVFVGGAKNEKGEQFDMSKFHPFTMDQNNAWHVDNVFEHTMKVVEEYDKILRADGAGDDERAQLLAAAFMHDLGKLDPNIIGTKDVEGIIRNTYHGHEDVSALAAEAILRGIKASNEEIELIRTVIKEHMRPHEKITDKQINKLIRNLGRNLVRRIVQHAKADAISKPGADVAHYDSLLDRVQNAQAPEPNQVKPVVPGGTIIQLFPTLDPKSGFIKEIQNHLQDMKDGNPQLTEQDGIAEIERMRPEIEQKYQGFKYQKKQQPQQHKAPVKPPVQAYFNLSKESDSGSVELVCGEIKIVDGALSIIADKGTFILKANEEEEKELSRLIGKRICGKGMVLRKTFTVSEYSVVRLDPNQEFVPFEREDPSEMTQFQKGDKVRHRKRGLAFKQIDGHVAKIEGDLMYIKWDGVEEHEIFDLRDTVSIFGVLQKV